MPDILKLTPLSYIVVFGASITNFAMGVLEPTIALYLLELNVSYSRLGEILAARFLVVAIGSIPLALFAARIGIAKILYLAGLSAIISGSILLFGQGPNAVYYFYLIAGVSQASISGPGAAILAENQGSKRVAAFALFSTTWMIPPAIGAAVSTFWFAKSQNENAEVYSSIFIVVFVVLVITGIIYIFFLTLALLKGNRPETTTDQRLSVVNQARLLFAPIIVLPLMLLSVSQFLSGAGAGSTLPFLPPYLKSLNASSQQISLLVMIMNISMGVATQFTTPLSKRFGEIQIYILTTILSIVTLLGIVYSSNLTIASALYILRGTFANMSAPIGQARLIGYIDNSVRATGSAYASTARWIGWTIFSPISGNYIEEWGYNTSFVFTSLIYLLSMILFVFTLSNFPDLEELKEQGLYEPYRDPNIN